MEAEQTRGKIHHRYRYLTNQSKQMNNNKHVNRDGGDAIDQETKTRSHVVIGNDDDCHRHESGSPSTSEAQAIWKPSWFTRSHFLFLSTPSVISSCIFLLFFSFRHRHWMRGRYNAPPPSNSW
jgi:hypothetical protein